MNKILETLRRRRLLTIVLLLVVLLVPTYYLTAMHGERSGWAFFNAGKTVVLRMAEFARAAQKRDAAALEKFYGADFRGSSLGFNHLKLAEQKDDVRIYQFTAAGGEQNKAAALEEWRQYLASFAEIEEIGIFVHRLEEWQADETVAVMRFELIGTPQGEPRSGIDRAYFRMRFKNTPAGVEVVGAALVEGDRVISARPHFVDVAPQAGVNFKNQYYPEFFRQPLKFGMLIYGPAGITAADVDNDGFYDLFIPDGVESKLFRNLGDGSFADITQASGLSGLDGVSVGLFADYDNDGYKDFFVSRTFTPNQLYHNNGDGTFTNVTEKAGIGADCCTTVASWGDYNNDGFLDLYVGRYLEPRTSIPTTFYARNGEPNQLYRNNGDGTFTNVTEKAGVGETGLCLGTVFGDYDDDGDLDLYVVNDFGRKTLYRNNGDETFTDVTVATNTLAYGAGMSASFGDYDNDLDLDIYVAHIRSEEGWFAEKPTVLRYMFNTWRQGVWRTDMPLYFQVFRQSGFDFIKVFKDMASGNTLLRNRGDGRFDDVSWEADANPPGWFWGSGFYDFDNDAWQDIYAANGWVYNEKETEIELEFLNNVVSKMQDYKTGAFFNPANFNNLSWHGWERNRHLINRGNGKFKEIGRATDSDLLVNSRGLAVADFWNRGVLDMAISASTDRHALLKNEVGQARNWLAVELEGAAGALPKGTNRDAVGARVIISYGGQKQLREIVLGDGYGSQSSLRAHFGLGDARSENAPMVDELTVIWPRSGQKQVFKNVAANRIIAITEGKDNVVEKVYAPPAAAPTADLAQGTPNA